MSDHYPGDTIKLPFYHANTGVANASWTKSLFRNGLSTSQSVVVTELGSNYYNFQFVTSTEDGSMWSLHLFETANPGDGDYWFHFKCNNAERANVVQQNGADNSTPGLLAYIKSALDHLGMKIGGF